MISHLRSLPLLPATENFIRTLAAIVIVVFLYTLLFAVVRTTLKFSQWISTGEDNFFGAVRAVLLDRLI